MGCVYKALEGNSSEGRQNGGEAKRWRAGCVAEGGGDADTLRGTWRGQAPEDAEFRYVGSCHATHRRPDSGDRSEAQGCPAASLREAL